MPKPSPVPLVALLLVPFAGCSSKAEPATAEEDPQFTADYVDDYESDSAEDQAQADEQAQVDGVDDLDDVEVLDGPTPGAFSTASLHTAGTPPKHGAHGPVSIMEDDPNFSGPSSVAHLTEARQLGVRIVRVMVMWKSTLDPTKGDPTGTAAPSWDKTNPGNYDWTKYDTIVDNARAAGMQVLITLAAPMPYWGSEQPSHCVEQQKADPTHFWSCSWKPDVRRYAQWVTAVGRHFAGTRIWGWTLWNEPNIGAFVSGDDTFDDAMHYRKMWFAARKALRKTAGVRARVLFGDVANGGVDPNAPQYQLLRHALCMKSSGEVYTGTLYKDCPDAPRRVQASGVAFHPYSADPTMFKGSLAAIESEIDQAEARGRLAAGRGLYLTEDGFLTAKGVGAGALGGAGTVSLDEQAIDDNLAEHVAYDDKRVRSIAQYELLDEGRGIWDCGLKHPDDTKKPAYDAYRVSIDVIRIDASTVEVFGLARLASRTPVLVQGQHADGTWTPLDAGLPTDETGFGKQRYPSAGIVAWQLQYLGSASRATKAR